MSDSHISLFPIDEDAYRCLRETAGWFTPDWGYLELTGEDRLDWLQGQQTNDLRSLKPGDSVATCFCPPTGQLLTTARIWFFEDRFMIGAPNLGLPAILKRCEEMVILEDVAARELALRVVSVQGPEASHRLDQLLAEPAFSGCHRLEHNRTGEGGWDLLLPDEAAAQAIGGAFSAVGDSTVDLARLEAGFPVFGVDTDAKTLPPELGPAFEAASISYKKGCYTGQEVLMRLHSRGHTNRTWRALVCDSPVSPGATVSSPHRDDAGKVTSAGVSPRFGPIAAAMLRKEAAAEGEVVQVQGPDGLVSAVVRSMPLLEQPVL